MTTRQEQKARDFGRNYGMSTAKLGKLPGVPERCLFVSSPVLAHESHGRIGLLGHSEIDVTFDRAENAIHVQFADGWRDALCPACALALDVARANGIDVTTMEGFDRLRAILEAR